MASGVSSLILDPPRIHEVMMYLGVKKAHIPLRKMVVLGIMSGFYVALGAHTLFAVTAVSSGAPEPPTVLLGAFMFALALVGILMVGGELFTGNCLLVVAVLSRRIRLREMFFDWAVVYVTNLVGIIIFAVLLYATGLYGFDYAVEAERTAMSNRLCATAHKKTYPDAWELFFRSIFANFSVCLAVLLALGATSASGKVITMLMPIGAFVVGGFEHCIANMAIFSLATLVRCPPAHERYWINLAVVTPGNILGAFIIAMCYYYVTLHGTENILRRVPIYGPDGVTICGYCQTPLNMSFAAPGAQRPGTATEPAAEDMVPPKAPSSLRMRRTTAPNASFCGGPAHHSCLKCAHNNSIVVAPSVSSSYAERPVAGSVSSSQRLLAQPASFGGASAPDAPFALSTTSDAPVVAAAGHDGGQSSGAALPSSYVEDPPVTASGAQPDGTGSNVFIPDFIQERLDRSPFVDHASTPSLTMRPRQ